MALLIELMVYSKHQHHIIINHNLDIFPKFKNKNDN
jgi:hypothetical protein